MTAEASLVKIVWQDDQVNRLGTFPKAATYLANKNLLIDTLMNGGIFEPGGVPSGLLIQHGKVLKPLNLNEGKGNFFLKPNGVFFATEDGASIITSSEFPQVKTRVSYAAQSGPILLRKNKMHPVFKKDSKFRLHRNGVGIKKMAKSSLS